MLGPLEIEEPLAIELAKVKCKDEDQQSFIPWATASLSVSKLIGAVFVIWQ